MKRAIFSVFGLLLLPLIAFGATQEFDMVAEQFQFSPSTITVTEGDTVVLNIRSIDVDHGINISAFGVNEIIGEGETVTVEFEADTAGEYTFFCSFYCGSGHGSMRGTLVVEEATASTEDDETEEEEGADTTAPVISSVRISGITQTTVNVNWEADEFADSYVEYGVASGRYTARSTEIEDSAEYEVTLAGLTEGTTYYYRVVATDAEGNEGVTAEDTFTTAATIEEVEEEEVEEDTTEGEAVQEEENTRDDEEEIVVAESTQETVAEEVEEEEPARIEITEMTLASTSIDGTADEPNRHELGGTMYLFGTGKPGASVTLEFCCSVERTEVTVNDEGTWMYEGIPSIGPGPGTVKIYYTEDGTQIASRSFEVVQSVDIEGLDEPGNGQVEEDKNPTSGNGLVMLVLVLGIALMVGAGVIFVKQMKREQ